MDESFKLSMMIKALTEDEKKIARKIMGNLHSLPLLQANKILDFCREYSKRCSKIDTERNEKSN